MYIVDRQDPMSRGKQRLFFLFFFFWCEMYPKLFTSRVTVLTGTLKIKRQKAETSLSRRIINTLRGKCIDKDYNCHIPFTWESEDWVHGFHWAIFCLTVVLHNIYCEIYRCKRAVFYSSRPRDTLYMSIQNNNNNKKSQEFVYLCFHLTLCKYVFTICICMLFIHTHTWGLCVCVYIWRSSPSLYLLEGMSRCDARRCFFCFFLAWGASPVLEYILYICRAERQNYDP